MPRALPLVAPTFLQESLEGMAREAVHQVQATPPSVSIPFPSASPSRAASLPPRPRLPPRPHPLRQVSGLTFLAASPHTASALSGGIRGGCPSV